MDGARVLKTLDSGTSYSISEVISFLKKSYRSADFTLAEVILRAREKKITMENEALEFQMKKCLEELRRKAITSVGGGGGVVVTGGGGGGVELARELEVCRNKCRDLGFELEKKKMECGVLENKLRELGVSKVAVEDELKECRRICSELEERVGKLEEERRGIVERENRAQERIVGLAEELAELEMEEKAKYDELKKENEDLECGKKRAEDEIEVWKKKVKDLEGRLSGLGGGELSGLRCKELGFPRVMEVDDGYKDEARVARMNQSVSKGGASGTRLIKNDKVPNTATANPVEGISGSRNAGSPINIQCNQPLNTNRKKIDSTPTDLGYGCRAKQQLDFNSGCSGGERLYPELNDQIKTPDCVIVVSDGEEEVEKVPRSTINIKGGGLAHILIDNAPIRSPDNEEKHSSGKYLKQLCAEQSHDEDGNSSEENLVRSTSKRRRRIVTSESESEGDDRIPICKLKRKKHEQVKEKVGNSSRSPLNLHSQALVCRDDNAEESTSPTRRRLLSLRQCEEKNCRTERTCPEEITLLNRVEMNGLSYKKQGGPDSENYKENLVEEVGLGGNENEPETSASTDSSTSSSEEAHNDLSFGPIISLLRRKRDMKAKFEFEADMLSSFEENPELCMKAVCALYRQQTSEEKLVKGSLHHNNRGFSKFDALRGTTLAEFLTDGDPKNDVKKSIEELKVFDRKGLEDCKRLARHYSKQLFSIYQNKEDPFFRV